ncbi:MAG: hypothetical protein K2J15_02985 [Muribaculaceae bacterium]|nr:hypothetical protein [Muribaculaceae bacterium]
MGCITALLLIISVAIMVAFDILLWSVTWSLGLVGILSIIGFIIAYCISGNFSLSPRDYIRNSAWGIFMKKIGWAWGISLMLYAAGIILIWFISNW